MVGPAECRAPGRWLARLFAVTLASGLAAPAGAGAQLPTPPALVISPPTGRYYETQSFDLLLITVGDGRVTGGTATLDGADVTGPLRNCLVPGSLVVGGRTFRCPAVQSALPPGSHVLAVSLFLDDGSRLEGTVTWDIAESAEP